MPDGGAYHRFDAENRVRVLLLLASLQGGGAERVAVHLLNRSDPALINVRLGLLQKSGPYLAHADPSRIDVSPIQSRWLDYDGANSSFYRPDRLLAGAVLGPTNAAMMIRAFKPDVVMSFTKGFNLIAYMSRAFWGSQRPHWIAREGNNTAAVIDDEVSNPLARRVAKRMVRGCYRTADCVLANSRKMAKGLARDFDVDPRKLRVINNPIDIVRIESLSAEPMQQPPARPFVVTVGRLEYQKGQDVLLRAFAGSPHCRDLDLVILGKGSQEKALRALAQELGIAHRVRFVGFVANPWAYIAKARLFALPSRWEGFPTVVAEALACGAPVLATDCDFGPSEIVEHGDSGWIVPHDNVDAFQGAMDMILSSPDLASALAARGKLRVQQFGIDRMVAEYSSLFMEQAVQRRASLAERGELALVEA